MRFVTFVLFLMLLYAGASGSDFYDFLTRLNLAPHEERQALVDSFLNDLPGGETPITEDSLAHFIYAGSATSVAIAGDHTGWSQYELYMMNVLSTNFWYRTLTFPEDARIDYKLVLDGANWVLDPLNPHTILGGYGPNSELAMPQYIQPPEVQDFGYPTCEIITYSDFYSPQLGNYRTIRVVLPPGYEPIREYPVMIVHDGSDYLELAQLDLILAYMAVHEPHVELPICICIPPVDRTEEYAGSQQEAFGRFIIETVIPYVNERYATSPDDPLRWGSMGASNGGNISLYLAGTYPLQFAKILVMSPYIPAEQYDLIAVQPTDAYEIYLNWGLYDIALLIPLIEDFNRMMADSGIVHYQRRFNEGHSWGLWRATIDQGLMFLFGGGVSVQDEPIPPPHRESLHIETAPNPFSSGTTVRFKRVIGEAGIRILDLHGRIYSSSSLSRGEQEWTWYPSEEICAGRYIVEVSHEAGRSFLPVMYIRD